MSGIYIHIPFCKQACHYCDFHFSTSLKHQTSLVDALVKELELRRDSFLAVSETVDTVYFGGGTPSILPVSELDRILESIRKNYRLHADAEITLECNPDDLVGSNGRTYCNDLIQLGFNRLSLGIQSFQDADLKLMNRAHDANMAFDALKNSTDFFKNISVDLIYGIPGSESADLERALQYFIDYSIPHISAYALTVEHKTALEKLIAKGEIPAPDEAALEQQFLLVRNTLREAGYDHYEISNFGKPNFHSRHNSSYWSGKPYLGIGPSAHSYLGNTRLWNISNNVLYVKALEAENLPSTSEKLSTYDRHNEFVMTQMRLEKGISLSAYETDFGLEAKAVLLKQAKKYLAVNQLEMSDTHLKISEKGLFFADGIAADFFLDASDGILNENA